MTVAEGLRHDHSVLRSAAPDWVQPAQAELAPRQAPAGVVDSVGILVVLEEDAL